MNILIIDDDAGFRNMLFSHLHDHHQVSVLCNGHNAVSLLADPRHGFNVVLIDLKMPRLDGKGVVNSLAGWSEVGVSFVVISGMMNETEIKKLPNVAGVLKKPFNLRELDEILKKIPSTNAAPKMRSPLNTGRSLSAA